jgi:hypothetical protein
MCEKLPSFLYFSEMRGATVVSRSHEPTTFTKWLHPHRSTRFPSSLGSSPNILLHAVDVDAKSNARPSHQRLLLVPTATPHLTNRRPTCVRARFLTEPRRRVKSNARGPHTIHFSAVDAEGNAVCGSVTRRLATVIVRQ